MTPCQAGCLEQQDQAHHIFCQRLAHTDCVGAQQLELQYRQVRFGYSGIGQLAKASVHAVDRRAAISGLLHQCRAVANALAAGSIKLNRQALWAAQPAQLRQTQLARNEQFMRHLALSDHRQIQAVVSRALFGNVVARVRVAHHASGRVVEQHPAQFFCCFKSAVGDDHHT